MPKQQPKSISRQSIPSGLCYFLDNRPGIRRVPHRGGFRYYTPDGKALTKEKELRRIRALAIPPAWEEVWICPHANGHLQATGRDAKGRKQYRYHPAWREHQDSAKYERILSFGHALVRLRRRVNKDLARRGLPREKVLASVVRLLETTLIRVGNDEYARSNNSYGLSTMQDKHAKINGSTICFQFLAKSGKRCTIALSDRKLARIVQRCKDLPGQELFQYVDERGRTIDVRSTDINAYIRSVCKEDFTAKDFRTWAATVLAALALQEFRKFDSQAQAKRHITHAIETVAKQLGNTPSICRKSYVHPAVVESYLDGTLLLTLRQRTERMLGASLKGHTPEEAAVLAFLQQRLARESRRRRKPRSRMGAAG